MANREDKVPKGEDKREIEGPSAESAARRGANKEKEAAVVLVGAEQEMLSLTADHQEAIIENELRKRRKIMDDKGLEKVHEEAIIEDVYIKRRKISDKGGYCTEEQNIEDLKRVAMAGGLEFKIQHPPIVYLGKEIGKDTKVELSLGQVSAYITPRRVSRDDYNKFFMDVFVKNKHEGTLAVSIRMIVDEIRKIEQKYSAKKKRANLFSRLLRRSLD